ncbi:MAG: hypothetical protein K2G32_05420 [Oscillospiraceae bacterium]|nr:hypothetical protein [Oscillospiraceae bacterium]
MVTFANNKSYETVRIMGGTENYQGQQRKTLAISICSGLITLEEAKQLYKNAAALSEITITTQYTVTEQIDGEEKETVKTETNIQPDFTLPVELTLSELNTGDGETTEVVTIKVAQKSALEIEQESQAAAINDTQLALIELAGLMGGE